MARPPQQSDSLRLGYGLGVVAPINVDQTTICPEDHSPPAIGGYAVYAAGRGASNQVASAFTEANQAAVMGSNPDVALYAFAEAFHFHIRQAIVD